MEKDSRKNKNISNAKIYNLDDYREKKQNSELEEYKFIKKQYSSALQNIAIGAGFDVPMILAEIYMQTTYDDTLFNIFTGLAFAVTTGMIILGSVDAFLLNKKLTLVKTKMDTLQITDSEEKILRKSSKNKKY